MKCNSFCNFTFTITTLQGVALSISNEKKSKNNPKGELMWALVAKEYSPLIALVENGSVGETVTK